MKFEFKRGSQIRYGEFGSKETQQMQRTGAFVVSEESKIK